MIEQALNTTTGLFSITYTPTTGWIITLLIFIAILTTTILTIKYGRTFIYGAGILTPLLIIYMISRWIGKATIEHAQGGPYYLKLAAYPLTFIILSIIIGIIIDKKLPKIQKKIDKIFTNQD